MKEQNRYISRLSSWREKKKRKYHCNLRVCISIHCVLDRTEYFLQVVISESQFQHYVQNSVLCYMRNKIKNSILNKKIKDLKEKEEKTTKQEDWGKSVVKIRRLRYAHLGLVTTANSYHKWFLLEYPWKRVSSVVNFHHNTLLCCCFVNTSALKRCIRKNKQKQGKELRNHTSVESKRISFF